jgi:hypothetical protein
MSASPTRRTRSLTMLVALSPSALPGAHLMSKHEFAMRLVTSGSPCSGSRKRAPLCQGLPRRERRQVQLPPAAERWASVVSIVARPPVSCTFQEIYGRQRTRYGCCNKAVLVNFQAKTFFLRGAGRGLKTLLYKDVGDQVFVFCQET